MTRFAAHWIIVISTLLSGGALALPGCSGHDSFLWEFPQASALDTQREWAGFFQGGLQKNCPIPPGSTVAGRKGWQALVSAVAIISLTQQRAPDRDLKALPTLIQKQ
jgi:hypothetical protein